MTRRALVTGAMSGAALGIAELTSTSSAAAVQGWATGGLPAPRPIPVRPHGPLKYGSSGAAVVALQRRLNALGYWVGSANGTFGLLTRQGVWALQKAAGLTRSGIVTPRTRAALDRGVRPRPRTTSGTALEIDKRHQLLLVVSQGRLRYTFNTSTGGGYWYTTSGGGRARATTPTGRFSIYSRYTSGWQNGALGAMWRPTYFYRGWAIHGSSSVPPYPASHGCARLTPKAMDLLYAGGWVPVGRTVIVY
jgi:peptidoglycan hydrolase-like protein with peptidoglycan-binding domain